MVVIVKENPILEPTIDNEVFMVLSKKLTDLYRNIKGIEEESGI